MISNIPMVKKFTTSEVVSFLNFFSYFQFLPACASEQGSVIGFTSSCSNGLLLENKAPVLAETPVSQCSHCYSAVSASLTNPSPDISNYSPFCHTHYLILRINTSLVLWARLFTKLLWKLILQCCSVLLQNLVGNSCLQRSNAVP